MVIPTAVFDELSSPATPPKVRAWVDSLPTWAVLRKPAARHAAELGAGESEAISLALELAVPCLIDDAAARAEAKRVGLTVSGLLGTLAEAKSRGWLDGPTVRASLARTTFRANVKLLDETLGTIATCADELLSRSAHSSPATSAG